MRRFLSLTWALCGLSVLSAQTPYTLKSCLETGLERNYSIRIARNDERISSSNATRAAAGALPTLDFSAGYDGALSDSRTRPRAGETSSENGSYDQTVSAGLDLEWTIFEGFRIRTDYRRLQELKAQGELETRIAIEDFVASLAAEYYNFVQQKIRLKNFRYAVSLSKERLRIVEARYRIGSFSRLDLLQARVDFNADSSQYITQQELVFASRIRLNELMAVDSVDRHILVLDSLIRVDETLDRRELERQMLRANASLLRSAREQTLAELDLQTLRSRNYPYLKLGAGYGYSLNRYGSGSTLQRRTLGPDAGLTLGMTIFDGNRRREQRNARIEIDNARLRTEQLELSLEADFSNFWQAYRNNVELLKLEEENLVAANENYEIAMERYLLGDLSGIEMREAQSTIRSFARFRCSRSAAAYCTTSIDPFSQVLIRLFPHPTCVCDRMAAKAPGRQSEVWLQMARRSGTLRRFCRSASGGEYLLLFVFSGVLCSPGNSGLFVGCAANSPATVRKSGPIRGLGP